MRVTSYAAAAASGALLVLTGAVPPTALAAPAPTCHGLPATIVGTDGDDHLSGTEGADVIWLGAGQDSVRAGGGADTVCGGPGKDSLDGGPGDDWLDGESDGDYNVLGGPGDDAVHGGDGDDVVLRGDGGADDDGSAAVDGADHVHGDAGDETLSGEPGFGADVLDGGEGNDRVTFGRSDRGVVIDVGAGTATGTGTGDVADTLVGIEEHQGSQHADHLVGSSGDDVLDGGYGEDRIDGLAGDDTLVASGGRIEGGEGDDRFPAIDEPNEEPLDVDLGPGDDRFFLDALRETRLHGGPGDDVFEVVQPGWGGLDYGGTYAFVYGGGDDDVLTFEHRRHRVRIDVHARTATWRGAELRLSHVNEFHGSLGDDVILGSARRDDRLFGMRGDDVLRGRGGPDLLVGGAGHDVAYGGPGRDTCTAERRRSCTRP